MIDFRSQVGNFDSADSEGDFCVSDFPTFRLWHRKIFAPKMLTDSLTHTVTQGGCSRSEIFSETGGDDF